MHRQTHALETFDDDAAFFGQTELLVAVKSFDLAAIRKRYLESRQRSKAGSVERRAPAPGGLVYMRIENGVMQQQEIVARFTEVRGVDFQQPNIAVSSENKIYVFDSENAHPTRIRHPWLSYIHTVKLSSDNKKCLVSSSGLDSILEFELGSGDCLWHWLAWEHGLNQAENPKTGETFLLTRDKDESQRLTKAGKKHQFIEDPGEQHLPTAQRAAFINSAEYTADGTVLATLFHKGEVIEIEQRSGAFTTVLDGLSKPHGGMPYKSGYLVTNTGGGNVQMKTPDTHTVFDFTKLPGKAAAVKDLEWLQSSHIKRNTVVTIDSNRTSFVFFDAEQKKRCMVAFDKNWAVQDFVFLTGDCQQNLATIKAWFKENQSGEND